MADVKLAGNEGSGASASTIQNYIRMSQQTAVLSGIAKSIQIQISGTGNTRVGIYADNSGEPGTLLASSDSFVSVSGWNTVNIGGNLAIVKDQKYWLAAIADAGAEYWDGVAGTYRFKSYTFGALPNPAGSGYSSGSARVYHIAVYGSVGGVGLVGDGLVGNSVLIGGGLVG